jgi:hypothetical protein
MCRNRIDETGRIARAALRSSIRRRVERGAALLLTQAREGVHGILMEVDDERSGQASG